MTDVTANPDQTQQLTPATDRDQTQGDPVPSSQAKLVYNVTEAADQLGIGRTLIYDLIRTGALRSMKLGERRLIARCDLEAFVDTLRAQEVA